MKYNKKNISYFKCDLQCKFAWAFHPFSPRMSLPSLSAQTKCKHFTCIFIFSLKCLRHFRTGKAAMNQSFQLCSVFAAHGVGAKRSTNKIREPDGKPKQFKLQLMQKAFLKKNAFLCEYL